MKDWLKWVLLGVLSLVFGFVALGHAVAASLAVTTITGVLFLISGGFQIAAGVGADTTGNKILSIGLGIMLVLLGGSFLANPMEGTVSLTMLVTTLLAISGVLRLIMSWVMRATPYFWPMLISGALSVLLAGYIIANFAAASVSLLGILLGIELLFNGAGLIVLGLFLRNNDRTG